MAPRQHSAAALLALLAGSASSAMAQSTEPFPAQFQLSSLAAGAGTNGFVLNGINNFDRSGFSVSSAGDVNGDGIDDIIIGAYQADPNGKSGAGESYVVFGGAGVGSGGVIQLSSLNGTNGFVLNGFEAGDRSGVSVSSAGDVNGDGIGDVVIGANLANSNAQTDNGKSYVVFGAVGVGASGEVELKSRNGSNGFVLNGVDASDFSGRSVSSAGDVNGDGFGDLILGANGADPNGVDRAGESYVIFGGVSVSGTGGFSLTAINGSNGFVLNGIDDSDFSGQSVSSAGDVNGDGIDDLIIGAVYADPNGFSNAGESYVVFGGVGVGSGGAIELSSLNGTNGYVLNGIGQSHYSGRSVSSAGDVNGDGIDDLIIGAVYARPNGVPYAGESYVVFGGPGVGVGGKLNLSSLNGTNGFVLNGIDINDRSGQSVSSAGDVNGDGIDDLIIGADRVGFYAGESYVVFGGPGVGIGGELNLSSLNGTNGFAINGIDADDYSGGSVSSAGDVNGDGIGDLIIGARNADPNGTTFAGESYVVFGRAIGQRWVSPTGGNWDTGSSWLAGVSPSIGITNIVTPLGVTVTGPAGAVFLDSLTLGASLGRTTLELQPFSLVSVTQAFELSASASLGGSGLFAAEGGFTNNGQIRPADLGIAAPLGLLNSGEIDISALSTPSGYARLDVFGPIVNQADGRILLHQGNAELSADAGVLNDGVINISFASAVVYGPVINVAGGLVSISGASNALFTGDFSNASTITLTDDSSLVILGSIFGDGVSGPGGGGTAGTVYVEGGVIPGLVGQPLMTSSFDGDLDLGTTAYTIIEIGGTEPGVTMDQLATATHLGAGGTLDIQLVDGYVPQPSDVYQVLQFSTVSGSFSSVVLDPALISAGANSKDLLTNGTIFIAASCPVDLNGDGIADFGDIQTFIALFLVQDLAVDFNGDGIIDFGDIQSFVAAFLAGCP